MGNIAISGLCVMKTSERIRGEEAVLQWPYTPSSERTVNDCFSCFDLSSVFQMEKNRKDLYTQDIWREK